jgi:hypothetical protein
MREIRSTALFVGIIPSQVFTLPHPKKVKILRFPAFNPSFVTVINLPKAPRYLAFDSDVIYVLSNDCQFFSFSLSKRILNPMASIYKFVYESEVPVKTFAFLPDISRFVSGSLFHNSFHAFRIDATSVTYLQSMRQASMLGTLNSAGASHIVTSWQDSSLTLWDLSSPSQEPVYRVTPHLTTVVDVDTSVNLKVIGSLDRNRNCMLSWIATGRLLRSFIVDGADSVEKLLVFAAGFVAVLSVLELPTTKRTTIQLFGIDTRKVAEVVLEDEVVEWQKAEFESAVNCLVVAQKTRKLVVLELPTLAVVMQTETEVPVASIVFSRQVSALLVADRKGTVSMMRFGSQ